MLAAIQEATDLLADNVEAAIDQQFTSTASGKYLVQLGQAQGFAMPPNSGLDLQAFEQLVPIMTADPKQIRLTIERLVEAFYGHERTSPAIQATQSGPFGLVPGDDLLIETQSGLTTIAILEGELGDFTNVTTGQLASIINAAQADFTADEVIDRITGASRLRLTASTRGLTATLRVAGGTLQNLLQFPRFVPTAQTAGTTLLLTRTTPESDLLTVTWNGTPPDPQFWRVHKDDVLTLRGLLDGADPWSVLNGTHVVVDSGFDYLVIRNDTFNSVTSTLILTDSKQLAVTQSEPLGLFDQEEQAIVSQIVDDEIDITVPAVPPLVRRSLKGSAHLHGQINPVITFTRGTIQLAVPTDTDEILPGGQLRLRNRYHRFAGIDKMLRTITVDSNPTQPTYVVSTDDADGVLPWTVAQPFGIDPIEATLQSDRYVITFPYRHGLWTGWAITLAGFVGTGNATTGRLNQEHQVEVINDHTVAIYLSDASGDPVLFSGFTWGPADVVRQSTTQPDGSDFYLQFASSGAAAASGLTAGRLFMINTSGGVDVEPILAGQLRGRRLVVQTVVGATITFTAGLGLGSDGTVMTAISGTRSGEIGGASGTQYLNVASATNLRAVFTELEAVNCTAQISSNPNYVGSFLYDPDGVSGVNLTVSKLIVGLADDVLAGDSPLALIVDAAEVDGEPFPQAGFICVDFGTGRFEGPIRLLAVVENGPTVQMLIDPAYRFKYSHDVGATVQYVRQNTAYRPTTTGSDYPVYLTGTAAARETMFLLVDQLVAAGVFVNKDVLYPDLRYQDPAINPFD